MKIGRRVVLGGLMGLTAGPTALLVHGCMGEDGSFRQVQQAIYEGIEDPGGAFAKFPQVGLLALAPGTPSGICTGVLIGPQTVLTAGHCMEDPIQGLNMVAGCYSYNYSLPNSPSGTPLQYRFLLPPSGDSAPQPELPADTYDVDGVQFNPAFYPDLVELCCGGAPFLCDECAPSDPDRRLVPSDLAMVHLRRPVTGVAPLPVANFVSPGGFYQPANGYYPLSTSTLPGTKAVIVGDSVTSQNPGELNRAYGVTSVLGVAFSANATTGGDPCNGPLLESQTCDGCVFELTGVPTTQLPDGGACGVLGDSGGPLVLNATSLGGSVVSGWGASMAIGGVYSAGPSLWDGNCDPSDAQSPTGGGDPAGTGRYSATFDTIGGTGPGAVIDSGKWIRDRLVDFDGDGVADAFDNCVVAPNPKQENCNQDAEDAKGYPRLGDACDPIPCARVTLQAGGSTVVASQSYTGYDIKTGRRIRDTFDVDTQGSNFIGNGSCNGDQRAPVAVPNVPTHHRFCQVDLAAGIVCKASSIDNQFLNIVEGPPAVNKPYHVAHVGQPAPGASFDVENRDYPMASYARRWRYVDDSTLWQTNDWIADDPNPCPAAYGCGTPLDGRFWIHAQTNVGKVGFEVGTGYRLKTGQSVKDGNHLSNNYSWLAPDEPYVSTVAKALLEIPFFAWKACIWCDKPWLPAFDGVVREDSYLFKAAGFGWGTLRRDGALEDVSGQLGTNLKTQLSSSTLLWVGAAEPQLNVGPGGQASGYHAIALYSSGTDVVDGATLLSGVLKSQADQSRSLLTRGGGPGTRSDWVGVFSRRDDLAFVVGGQSGSAYTGEVWMRQVSGSMPWARPSLGTYAPQKVLAATYSFVDHRLWILDEATIGGVLKARLVRVDPRLGKVLTVGEWARSSAWDKQWLVVDLDGRVLLASSSTSGNQYALARLDFAPYVPLKAVTVPKYQVLSGVLTAGPLVDVAGYLVAKKTATFGQFSVVRSASLGGTAVSLATLDNVL